MTTIEKLPVNFEDDIIDTTVSDKRRYNLINNSDGTVSLDDVTTYKKVGNNFGKEQVNKINGTINQLIDNTKNMDNTPDNQKSVLHAETAQTSENATNAVNAETAAVAELAKNATNAVTAQMAESAKTVENNFVLKNQATLTFNNNNVCVITDTRIKEDSLADVYFTQDSILAAEKAVITVESYTGRIELTAGRQPEGTIKASIVIRTV